MINDRLKSLVKFVDSSDKIIDIGCDHALLDIYLVKNKIIDRLIVSDISINALNAGVSNIKKQGLIDKIDARCGNGLDVLSDDDYIDTIIISGMGSNTIIKILNKKYLNNINKLIIQSNRDYDILRKYVVSNGFYIDKEEVICVNNKIYINIVFKKGVKSYKEEELKYGTNNMINKNIYYKYLINRNNTILKSVNDNDIRKKLIMENDYLKSILNSV